MTRTMPTARLGTLMAAALLGALLLWPLLATAGAAAQTGFDCAAVSEIPAAECAALVALYESTGGAGWTTSTGWLQTDTPCSWAGVSCAGGRVTELLLDNNNLSGELPPALGDLTQLTWLQLNDNLLSGTLPAALTNLSSLETLHLGNNNLGGSITGDLASLAALELLYLNNNFFTGTIPAELGDLPNLLFLYLNGLQLEGAVPANLCALQDTLLTANLDFNKLESLGTDACVASVVDPDWEDTQTVPPQDVRAETPNPFEVQLSWTPIKYVGEPPGGGFYQILMSNLPGGPYTEVGQTPNKNASSFTVKELQQGQPYYFVVRTFSYVHPGNKSLLISANSREVSAVPLALTLLDFSARGPAWAPAAALPAMAMAIVALGVVWRRRRRQPQL